MPGVTLACEGIDSVSLPLPAHNIQVDDESNQTVHETPSQEEYTVKHGPTRYRVTRTFEGLTDQEVHLFTIFWEQSGQAGADILYQYTTADGVAKSVPCRIIEPPKRTRVHRDNWDLTLVFKQGVHPDRFSEPNA